MVTLHLPSPGPPGVLRAAHISFLQAHHLSKLLFMNAPLVMAVLHPSHSAGTRTLPDLFPPSFCDAFVRRCPSFVTVL